MLLLDLLSDVKEHASHGVKQVKVGRRHLGGRVLAAQPRSLHPFSTSRFLDRTPHQTAAIFLSFLSLCGSPTATPLSDCSLHVKTPDPGFESSGKDRGRYVVALHDFLSRTGSSGNMERQRTNERCVKYNGLIVGKGNGEKRQVYGQSRGTSNLTTKRRFLYPLTSALVIQSRVLRAASS